MGECACAVWGAVGAVYVAQRERRGHDAIVTPVKVSTELAATWCACVRLDSSDTCVLRRHGHVLATADQPLSVGASSVVCEGVLKLEAVPVPHTMDMPW